MKGTRRLLFGLVVAVVVASVVLYFISTSGRGPAHTFTVVPTGAAATRSQLRDDSAALLRRLQSLGYADAETSLVDRSIVVTMYGSAATLESALTRALPAAKLWVRPLECLAAASPDGSRHTAPALSSVQCGAPYRLTAANLAVDTKTGTPTRHMGPDPAFAGVPLTAASADTGADRVLLEGGPHSGFTSQRLVLGRAAVGNSGIVSAQAARQAKRWVVDVTLTAAAQKSLDTATVAQFHAYVAVDLDGTVISTRLVEPTEPAYTTDASGLVLSAGFTQAEANSLADDLTSPLAAALRLSD